MSGVTAGVNSRERLAWAFLLGSFFVFVCAAIAIPLTARVILQNATELLPVFVQSNEGLVSVDGVVVSGPGRPVVEGARIGTGATAEALVTVSLPGNGDYQMASLEVFRNTTLLLSRADAPRFKMSDKAHELALSLEMGTLRLNVAEFEERPLRLLFTTPQGEVRIRQVGEYSLRVNNDETSVTVHEGRATLVANGVARDLLPEQRALIPLDAPPTPPLALERNLVQNGDFSNGWNKWQLFAWRIERENEPEGETNFTEVEGEPVLHILRSGVGAADVRVRQIIDEDITDYASLQLFLKFRIVGQSLGVCGVKGSECPLTVSVHYVDATGVERVWRHGFYTVGEVSDDAPNSCIACAAIQTDHDRVPLDQVTFYDVDLLQEMTREGHPPPNDIQSVVLEASGHSFEVEVMDVDLIVEE